MSIMKEMQLNDKIAERIREMRKAKQLNQVELADVLNVDKSTIAKYETGVSAPSVYMLVAIAKFFDVSTDYLLGLED